MTNIPHNPPCPRRRHDTRLISVDDFARAVEVPDRVAVFECPFCGRLVAESIERDRKPTPIAASQADVILEPDGNPQGSI
jgi:hypothetical protein